MLVAFFHKESFKEHLLDAFLSISSALGVYHYVPLNIGGNIWIEETIKSIFSILTAIIVLLISLIIRHFWNKRFKE